MQNHWETVYTTKSEKNVSWYQQNSSATHIERAITGRSKDEIKILDFGAGASTLVDALLELGFKHIVIADISASAIEISKKRLGEKAALVTWIVGDIMQNPSLFSAYAGQIDVWHDRAVFHFFTKHEERNMYKQVLKQTLAPNGHAIIATFADPDGPTMCSGLTVARYSAESLHNEIGINDYDMVTHERLIHTTPANSKQVFTVVDLRKKIKV